MVNSSSEYSYLKSEIENAGQTLLQIAQRTNNTAIADFLNEVLDKLPKEEFYLALLGLFKRGKSTLINAMPRKNNRSDRRYSSNFRDNKNKVWQRPDCED